jgi:hypothetical protein
MLDYMMAARDRRIRGQRRGEMASTNLTQENHTRGGLRAVSRGALAAGDLEQRQQKRSLKRARSGGSSVEGGPGTGLLGYLVAGDEKTAVAVAPVEQTS